MTARAQLAEQLTKGESGMGTEYLRPVRGVVRDPRDGDKRYAGLNGVVQYPKSIIGNMAKFVPDDESHLTEGCIRLEALMLHPESVASFAVETIEGSDGEDAYEWRAWSQYGYPIKTYSDGVGDPLWVYRDSMGVVGIVQSRSWETAYECVLDEILVPISEEDVSEAYQENGDLHDGYHYQPNATGTGIVQVDYNERLERLSVDLMHELGIRLEYRSADEAEERPAEEGDGWV